MSIKLDKILVPISFDECSRRALRYAIGLAEKFGAALEVVHAVETIQPALAPAPLAAPASFGTHAAYEASQRDAEALERRLSEMVAREKGGADVTATCEVVRVPLAELLRDPRLEYDLVVMGTHDHSWLERVFLSSHAQSAVSEASRPILVVPGPAEASG